MEITPLSRADSAEACALWNKACASRMPYETFNETQFFEKFFDTPHFDAHFLLAAKDAQGELLGFALAYIKKEYLQGETFENTPLYLTMLLVREDSLRKGVGTALLRVLEHAAQVAGKTVARITYRNPITLSWIVPKTDRHTHNNAPGVEMQSPAFAFFTRHGYAVQQTEYGMHLPLAQFVQPAKYTQKVESLAEKGIEVTLYDSARHAGFEELFTALHGEVWRKTIRDNLASETPLPVIVAVHAGRIVGFAGPVDKEPSGRGWFNGIATHPDYERRGIAFVMFCRLMLEFEAIGAAFSTLFTDANNPAAGLYESVGFCVAKQWAVMEKGL